MLREIHVRQLQLWLRQMDEEAGMGRAVVLSTVALPSPVDDGTVDGRS